MYLGLEGDGKTQLSSHRVDETEMRSLPSLPSTNVSTRHAVRHVMVCLLECQLEGLTDNQHLWQVELAAELGFPRSHCALWPVPSVQGVSDTKVSIY